MFGGNKSNSVRPLLCKEIGERSMFPKAGQWVWPNYSADDKQDHHTQIYIYIYFFSFFNWGRHYAGCGIIVPWPGIEPIPLLVKTRSPNHLTATEVYTETFDTSINIALSKSWSFIYHHTLQFLNNDSGKTFFHNKVFC